MGIALNPEPSQQYDKPHARDSLQNAVWDLVVQDLGGLGVLESGILGFGDSGSKGLGL